MGKDVGISIENLLKDRYKDWSGSKQFEGTGERWERWIEEMCWSSSYIGDKLREAFKAKFEDKYDEMLVSGPNEVWTLCPHHVLPCQLKVYIGYIPNGWVLGLSKFTRIATILGKRPTMQEQYVEEVADTIMRNLEPKGVGVRVIGIHGCMFSRGVRQEVPISTSVLKGIFMTDPAVRQEFYNMVKE